MELSESTIAEITQDLYRHLGRCGSLPVPAEDLVGDVILRLLSIDDDRVVERPLAYARAILKNLIRDHLRRAERAQRVLRAVAHATPEADEMPTDAARFDDGELVAYLLENTRLSPLQSRVLRMVYLDGMRLTDVAVELSRNPGTILRHLHRALAKLERSAAELELHR